MLLIFVIVVLALVFEFINGFHDTANAIATTVATKVLTPRQAIVLAVVGDLGGAMVGTAVATTVGTGLVNANLVTPCTLLCALFGAIVWNLATWWMGLPSSSSHALFGGLCGAALATAHNDWSVIHWLAYDPVTHKAFGLWPKVILPMIVAPVLGISIAFLFMAVLLSLFHSWRPVTINRVFRISQLFSAGWMSFGHGMNDAQKTMGIIALTLFTATTQTHAFDHLPGWLGFLRATEFKVDMWIVVSCAITLAAGTATGGWRIIHTLGKKMVKLQPIHGFAAQSTAAGIIQVASICGMPLSTTHIVSSAIMGVGATKRLNAVKWSVVERMVWAWVLTLPVAGLLSFAMLHLLRFAGFVK